MTITSISRTLLRTHLLYGSSPTYRSQAWSCQLPKAIDSVSRATNTWPGRTLTAILVTAAPRRYLHHHTAWLNLTTYLLTSISRVVFPAAVFIHFWRASFHPQFIIVGHRCRFVSGGRCRQSLTVHVLWVLSLTISIHFNVRFCCICTEWETIQSLLLVWRLCQTRSV